MSSHSCWPSRVLLALFLIKSVAKLGLGAGMNFSIKAFLFLMEKDGSIRGDFKKNNCEAILQQDDLLYRNSFSEILKKKINNLTD